MGPLARIVANPLVLILVITAGGLALAGRFWSSYRETLLADPRFRLQTESIQVTAPPEWLPPSEHQQWIRSLGWEGRSLLQPSLVSDVANGLRQDPWVEEVVSVRKSPAGLQVEVRYGRPLLVELPQGKILPVNARGHVLDTQSLRLEAAPNLLRIAVRDLVAEPLKLGELWPDPRVVRAAELGRHLASCQEAVQLAGIYVHDLPVPGRAGVPARDNLARDNLARDNPAQDNGRAIQFRLWTKGRNEIIWGNPIGQEEREEAPWEQKLAGLEEFVRRHGPIDRWDQLPNRQGNVLDLRSGQLVLLKNAKLAWEPPAGYH
jgi:hypothetical protein